MRFMDIIITIDSNMHIVHCLFYNILIKWLLNIIHRIDAVGFYGKLVRSRHENDVGTML